jgi:hypothetical protein
MSIWPTFMMIDIGGEMALPEAFQRDRWTENTARAVLEERMNE